MPSIKNKSYYQRRYADYNPGNCGDFHDALPLPLGNTILQSHGVIVSKLPAQGARTWMSAPAVTKTGWWLEGGPISSAAAQNTGASDDSAVL